MRYSVQSGVLEIRDSGDGKLTWRGTFDEGTVLCAVALPETEDCVVLVEYVRGSVANNVMRVRPDGTIAWRASPAPEFGPYVRIAIQDGHLQAWSWSGSMVRLDQELGAILERTFVK
jgi:hypothetical protein